VEEQDLVVARELVGYRRSHCNCSARTGYHPVMLANIFRWEVLKTALLNCTTGLGKNLKLLKTSRRMSL